MKYGRFIYFLILAFVIITLFTVYMQYNSSRNIRGLISGNEKLLTEFSYDKDLRNIQSHILTIESKVRGVIVTGDTSHKEGIDTEISRIETTMARLQKLTENDSTEALVDSLDYLLRKKVTLSDEILQIYFTEGKKAAEFKSAGPEGKRLTDQISRTIQKLETARREALAGITHTLDNNGRKASLWGNIFLVFVLLMTIVAFIFIIGKLKRQQELILDLDSSEKRAREAARVKENFMANMSHEIRTPMNAILGFTNLLQRQKLDEKSHDYVASIEKSGESLLTIINDILDLSKIEAGMMRIEEAPFSVRGMIHSLETMFRNRLSEKNLICNSSVDDMVPDTLIGDNIRLTQIFVNLLNNAIKFTPTGSITIYISGKHLEPDRFLLISRISDTGIGINPDKLAAIFERFEQAEDSSIRQYGGTGLGLSIVKELVQIQQGEIHAESEPGKGSAFIFSIPYRISHVPEDLHDHAQTPSPIDFSRSGIRILVAEDNEINQKLLTHLFREWNAGFQIVSNGAEAISLLKAEPFDLVLMDIQMPVMDGYTATQEIRNTLQLNIPVIAMTAHAMAGEREKCISYGMNDHLSKPIREQELASVIAKYIPGKTAEAGTVPMAPVTTPQGPYQFINLQYMKEISRGNADYEKTVIGQFIEMVPDEINTLKKTLDDADYRLMKETAHNMKTTISIMGLGPRLDATLEEIENGHPNDANLSQKIDDVAAVCQGALQEADALIRQYD